MECELCQSHGGADRISVREMMFGTRDLFTYFICPNCESLQLIDIPTSADLVRHYDRGYYAYKAARKSQIRQYLTAQRDRFIMGTGGGVVGALVSWARPDLGIQLLADLQLGRDARILDVGCGRGILLDRLAAAGFTNLTGIDPFAPDECVNTSRFRLIKSTLSQIDGEMFDLIMFHHSLEHVPNLTDTLRCAKDILATEGICLVRIPTTSSEAWKIYRENWVQIDAPRHFVIPSRIGLATAAERAGLRLERIIDDSTAFQFSGSEKYLRNVPLNANRVVFGRRQEQLWDKRAKVLNRISRGDQACFIFRHA